MQTIAILGNGAIGYFTALAVRKLTNSKTNVLLIGDEASQHSATLAAGAMHAVFGELEELKDGSLETEFFELGLKSRTVYEEILEHSPELLTSPSTLVYLKKDPSEFEYRNFNTVEKTAQAHNCCDEVKINECKPYFQQSLKIEKVIRLKGEFGFDPRHLLQILEKQSVENGIELIKNRIEKVYKKRDKFQINFAQENQEELRVDKIINCLGAHSNEVMPEELQTIRQYQGVGTAFLVQDLNLPKIRGREEVLRTVNRGGAQCGLHIVPTKRGFYIGAGNYLAVPSQPELRLETLRYLLNGVGNEILPPEISYNMKGMVLQGLRPRSFDGYPILGQSASDENLLWATGFNRVGLTLAPEIAEMIAKLAITGKSDIPKNWLPNRSPVSYESSRGEFILSRISNAIEHKLIDNNVNSINNKKNELKQFLGVAETSIRAEYKLPNEFGIHPDMYGVLYKK